jgi:hypothetical protein
VIAFTSSDMTLDESADRHDLRIKIGASMKSGEAPDDLEILARGVEHLDDVGIGHEAKKRRKIKIIGKGIDRHSLFRRRQLDHADLRPERGFAQKFGVDRDEGMLSETVADRSQFGIGGEKTH